MSYLNRLMQETGLQPRGAPTAFSAGPETSSVVEINDIIEAPAPAIPMPAPLDAPTAPVGPVLDPPRPSIPSTGTNAPPPDTFRTSEAIPAPGPDVARAGPALDPPFDIPASPAPVVEEITAEVEATPQPDLEAEPDHAPGPPPEVREEDYVVRTLRTIEDVRRWVAAGPAAPDIQGIGSDRAPLEVLDMVFGPVTGPASPARPDPGGPSVPRVELSPEIQNVTLSIGHIDLTVEAPDTPPAPAPPAPSPPQLEAMPDTAAQRLRRHYVNWPGRF